MAVPTVLGDLSTTIASNSPAGGDAVGTTLDDYLRAHAGLLAQAYAASLLKANNLSDLANAGTARTNLGLGAVATHALADFLQPSNNLSEVASASTARTNLGLGTSATHAATEFLQATNNLSDITSVSSALANLSLGVGLYTPTLTSVANVSASSASSSIYLRIGGAIAVFATLLVTPTTAGGTITQLGISLPVASDLAATSDCIGVGASNSIYGEVLGDATNNRAQVAFQAASASSQTLNAVFAYRVL